jgi:methanethiol S-methyltransferase
MADLGLLVRDGLLVAGFGVQHSLLATLTVKARIKRWWNVESIAWRSVESLCNVVYVLLAGSLWLRSSTVVWDLRGGAGFVMAAVFVASWLWYWELHLYEYDCGLAFGSTTLVSQLARQKTPALIPWKVGSRRWIRFPVHTAFFGMFFAIPHMTADLLILGIVANVYNVIGSILYDKRLEKLAGDSYFRYEERTGLIWPPIYRKPAGAADLRMPKPSHWRHPERHLPGVVVGLVLGGFYLLVIGNASTSPATMLKAGIAGLVGAIVVGFIHGRLLRPDKSVAWEQQQTDLSTTVALSSALGVVSWAVAYSVIHGSIPSFATFLPLWFTVQYLGHVSAYLAAQDRWGRERPGAASGPADLVADSQKSTSDTISS